MRVGSKFSLLLLSLAMAMVWPAAGQISSSSTLKNGESLNGEQRRFNGEWKFEVGGYSETQGKDNTAAATFYLNVNLDYQFAPWMHAHLSPRLALYSSRVQERYSDSGEETRLWMYDGYISIAPESHFELRGGALNQRFHGTGLLVSGLRSFPGVQERAKVMLAPSVKMEFISQQVIPTSHSLNTERVEQEALPTFMTQTLLLSGRNFDFLDWKVGGGLYDWSNIPDKVVFDSRLVGNEGYGAAVPGSHFRYDHQGWYLSSEACLCPNYWLGGVLEFERVHNNQASADAADAQLLGIGPRFTFGDIELDLRYRPYFSESDATVAAYSKSKFGNTNRRGYNLEANIKFKKEGFTIFAEHYNAKPINYDPNQRDLSIIYLGVETEYATF